MLVFISWSGDRSRIAAKELGSWLPHVIQEAIPFVSDQDIAVGSKWEPEIAENLQDAQFGIVCVTPENQESPWINYEAGALSKLIDPSTRVVPLLIGMSTSDLKPPLSQFQARQLDIAGVREVIFELNRASSRPLSQKVVEAAFERLWPVLDIAVSETIQLATETAAAPARSEREILSELLDLVRAISRESASPTKAQTKLSKRLTDFRTDARWTISDDQLTLMNLIKDEFAQNDNFVEVNLSDPEGPYTVVLKTPHPYQDQVEAAHLIQTQHGIQMRFTDQEDVPVLG